MKARTSMSRTITKHQLNPATAEINFKSEGAAKNSAISDPQEVEIVGLAAALPKLDREIEEIEARRPFWDGEADTSPEFERWREEATGVEALRRLALERVFQGAVQSPRVLTIRVALFDELYGRLEQAGIPLGAGCPTSLSGMAVRIARDVARSANREFNTDNKRPLAYS